MIKTILKISLSSSNQKTIFLKHLSCRKFTESAVKLPQRVFERYEFLKENYYDIETQAVFCTNEEKVLDFFREHGLRVPVDVLADLTDNIIVSQVDLSDHFNKECAPIIAEYILKMNRDHSLTFGRLLKNFAFMEIDSPLIWDALLKTFKQERMYRYVPVELLAETFINLSLNKNPPQEILKVIIPILYDHRHSLDNDRLELLLEALERLRLKEYGSLFELQSQEFPNEGNISNPHLGLKDNF